VKAHFASRETKRTRDASDSLRSRPGATTHPIGQPKNAGGAAVAVPLTRPFLHSGGSPRSRLGDRAELAGEIRPRHRSLSLFAAPTPGRWLAATFPSSLRN
jgi:hypothetical protein